MSMSAMPIIASTLFGYWFMRSCMPEASRTVGKTDTIMTT
jgi:hypothetical protein